MDELERNEIIEEIVRYLDCSGQFAAFSNALKCFEETNQKNNDKSLSILSFSIITDFPLLVELAGKAAVLLLAEPYLCQQLFNEVILSSLKRQEDIGINFINQAHVFLKMKSWPISPIKPLSMNCLLPKPGLFAIKGIITACTTPTKYRRSAMYQCTLEGCSGRIGQRVFGEQMLASLCVVCGCKTEEFLRARVNGEQVKAIFVHPDNFQSNFVQHQAWTVCFKDDLTKHLKLGVSYNVVASYKTPHVEGWGIEPTLSEHQWRFDNCLPPSCIPSTILALEESIRNTCSNCPWALTATLSSQLGSHLFPATSFFQLKTGLILSLASQSTEEAPVPLLAVGPDCCALLQSASQLSSRCVTLTSPTLCGTIGGSITDEWVEAGPLVLATGGVCYLGDWAKFTSGRSGIASQVVTALESGRVDFVSSNNTVQGSPHSQPLRAAVWTIWSGDKATSAAQAQLRTLIEVFGIPFIGDGSVDVLEVAEHLLCEAMQTEISPPNGLVSNKDLKEYLSIASSIKVHLTSEASRLLRNYFVASRRDRPDCLPLTAVKTMTSLAEAHARLCLRTQVIYEDVVLVVYLYEEAITALYGPSLLSPSPAVFGGLRTKDQHNSIGQEVSIMLKTFSVWLDQYIKSLLSGSSVNLSISEE